jgi:hypothetical protein
MAEHRNIPISENHRRGITSTLGLLDEMLSRFERLTQGKPAEGVLYRELDTLTDDQKRAIQAEIDALRKMLGELRDDLCLEIKTQDIARAIWSESSAFWAALVELGTKYLRCYGDMPEGFAEYFDPKVERIIDRVIRIADTAGHRKVGGGRQRPRPAKEAARDAPKAKTEGRQ